MPKMTRRIATVELADGRILTARIINPDLLRYEEAAARSGWAPMTVKDGVATLGDVNRQNTYQAWAALHRTGQYPGDYPAFANTDCVDIAMEEEEVDPTRPGPGEGSSPNSHGSDADRSPNSQALTTNS